jgi:acetyltransferase-like isoleucine patch superfamily enzyme
MIRKLIKRLLIKFSHPTLSIGTGCDLDINSGYGKCCSIGANSSYYSSNLGSYSYVAARSHISRTTIGNYCSIGSDVRTGLQSHPLDKFSTHPVFFNTSNRRYKAISLNLFDFSEEIKETYIGNDVWIGNGAMILAGCNIGNGAVIAAGAVVTKDVEPLHIVGGIPARVIGERPQTELRKNYPEWWELTPEKIKDLYNGL